MQSYIDILPQEILNIILKDCTYTEVAILEKMFDININYEGLLLFRYPGIHLVVQMIKTNIEYKYLS